MGTRDHHSVPARGPRHRGTCPSGGCRASSKTTKIALLSYVPGLSHLAQSEFQGPQHCDLVIWVKWTAKETFSPEPGGHVEYALWNMCQSAISSGTPPWSTVFQRDMTNHNTTVEENMHYPAEWKDHLFNGTLEGIGRAPSADLPSIGPTLRNSDGLISSRIFHRWQGVHGSTMKPVIWQTTPANNEREDTTTLSNKEKLPFQSKRTRPVYSNERGTANLPQEEEKDKTQPTPQRDCNMHDHPHLPGSSTTCSWIRSREHHSLSTSGMRRAPQLGHDETSPRWPT